MTIGITKQAESYLEALVKELEIPPSRYEQAERSYKSLGEWLHRDGSTVSNYGPDVFVQGSFKLGTAIKPQSADEEYDVDCVCSLTELTKRDMPQSDLKTLLGDEIKLYRKSKGITKAVHEGRRCWRLDYADGAQFHMDIVPSVPNSEGRRRLLEASYLDTAFADTAIAITDNEVLPQYLQNTDDWPSSNPQGYAEWFTARMGDAFLRKRDRILEEMKSQNTTASIEDIPTYRVRTPLQSAIMILKRHRDTMFTDDATNKPISIIISTLAAHAYHGEDTIGLALLSILARMKDAIEFDGRRYIIKNPTDALENFADKWEEYPEREQAFSSWLEKARDEFLNVGLLTEYGQITSILENRMGHELTEKARNSLGGSLLATATAASATSAPNISFGDEARKPKKPDGFA